MESITPPDPRPGSREYFLAEWHRFRELMGSREAWRTPEVVQLALKGLLHVYLNTDKGEEFGDLIHGTLREYDIRLRYALMMDGTGVQL